MSKGEIVTKACNVLVEVYDAIERMLSDSEKIIREILPDMNFIADYYSYSPNWLMVKDHYNYLLRSDTNTPALQKNERLYFLIQIFFCEGTILQKVDRTLKEPEIWAWLLKSTNADEYKASSFDEMLLEKQYFKSKTIDTNGQVYEYNYEEKEVKEKWHGWFLGRKLTEISSSEDLKTKIVNPLFERYDKSNMS